MKKQAYVNQMEYIFESSDILANPFMDYTKAELQHGFELQEGIYRSAAIGSAPRRAAFSAMAQIEVAFDAYAKAIKQFNVYVDEETTLRDILEDSYEIAHGVEKTVEEMRTDAGMSSIAAVSHEVVDKTKDISKKVSNSLFDGIFHASTWLSGMTNPSKRK